MAPALGRPCEAKKIRARWEELLGEVGTAALHAELVRRDPAAAESAMELNRQHTIDCLNRLEETP